MKINEMAKGTERILDRSNSARLVMMADAARLKITRGLNQPKNCKERNEAVNIKASSLKRTLLFNRDGFILVFFRQKMRD